MSDHLSALNLFVRVARTGSFSRAARELNLTQPTASRVIAALEKQIGATLFLRTTRVVTLTDAGTEYLQRVLDILSALEEANHSVRGTGELRGSLRIGTPSTFASRVIVPRLSAFVSRHSQLRVELQITDRRQDLIAEGLDVALRFGEMADSSAIARRIGNWPMIAVASPDYLSARGCPKNPADLAGHDVIAFGSGPGVQWPFSHNGRRVSINLDARLLVSASETAVRASVAGFGIFAAMAPLLRAEIAAGELVQLLPEWDMNDIDVHALFPTGQTAKPAARAFAEYLRDELRTL